MAHVDNHTRERELCHTCHTYATPKLHRYGIKKNA